MKLIKFVTLFSAAVLAVGTITPAFAQRYAYGDRDYRSDSGYSHDGAERRWERFLDDSQNRDFARIFRANPNIINDRRYMDQWTGVHDLFSRDPDVREYAEQVAR